MKNKFETIHQISVWLFSFTVSVFISLMPFYGVDVPFLPKQFLYIVLISGTAAMNRVTFRKLTHIYPLILFIIWMAASTWLDDSADA